MSSRIPVHHITGFDREVQHIAQQMSTRLRGSVVETAAEGRQQWVNKIGKVEMQDKSGRRTSVEYTDTPHITRLLTTQPKFVADTIEEFDRARTLISEDQEYRLAQAFAANRAIDNIIADSATADVTEKDTDADTTSTVSFDTSNQQVAVDYVVSGSDTDSNLTVPKVRKAWQILRANHARPGNMWAAISSFQAESLMRDKEFTSSDYNRIQPLVDGEVDMVSWMGFRWRISEELNYNATNVRRCLFYDRSAMKLAPRKEYSTRTDEIPDKHYMTQIYSDLDMGAVRVMDEWVVDVLCDETK